MSVTTIETQYAGRETLAASYLVHEGSQLAVVETNTSLAVSPDPRRDRGGGLWARGRDPHHRDARAPRPCWRGRGAGRGLSTGDIVGSSEGRAAFDRPPRSWCGVRVGSTVTSSTSSMARSDRCPRPAFAFPKTARLSGSATAPSPSCTRGAMPIITSSSTTLAVTECSRAMPSASSTQHSRPKGVRCSRSLRPRPPTSTRPQHTKPSTGSSRPERRSCFRPTTGRKTDLDGIAKALHRLLDDHGDLVEQADRTNIPDDHLDAWFQSRVRALMDAELVRHGKHDDSEARAWVDFDVELNAQGLAFAVRKRRFKRGR